MHHGAGHHQWCWQELADHGTVSSWRARSNHVWPGIAVALDALCAVNEVVMIEGAGSPAEIKLHGSDIVNMRVALHYNAACLLVTDIDRGGEPHLGCHCLPTLDMVFEGLAEFVEQHFEPGFLKALIA